MTTDQDKPVNLTMGEFQTLMGLLQSMSSGGISHYIGLLTQAVITRHTKEEEAQRRTKEEWNKHIIPRII